jgi:YaiO family outer membrane protein
MPVRPRSLLVLVIPFVISPTFSSAQKPFDPDSLFSLALRLQRTGETAAATLAFRTILNSFPNYDDARIQYAKLLAWDNQYLQAIIQYDSVLSADPGNVEARFGKAQTLEWWGRYRQAADILLALLQEQPDSPRFLLGLGRVYAAGGVPRRALEFYERAYFRAPADPDIMRGLARTHRTLGNRSLALHWYRRLLSSVPGDPEARSEIHRLTYMETHEIQVSALYDSFTGKSIPDHNVLQAEYYLTLNEDWKPFVHLARIEKFSRRDLRVGAGAYATPGRSWGVFIQALVSPDARIAPHFDATLELNGSFVKGIECAVGYRYLRFDTLHVNVAVPGLVVYFSDDAWLGIRWYFGFIPSAPTSASGTMTLWIRTDQATTLRIGGFKGNEIVAATTYAEISALKSSGGYAGLKTRISPHLAADIFYTYTARSLLSDSHAISLTMSFLF